MVKIIVWYRPFYMEIKREKINNDVWDERNR